MDADQHERSDEMFVKVLAHEGALESVIWPLEAVKCARGLAEMVEYAPGSSDGGMREVIPEWGLNISGNRLVRDLCATSRQHVRSVRCPLLRRAAGRGLCCMAGGRERRRSLACA